MKRRISRRQRELEELRELTTSAGGLDYSREVVDHTATGDAMENKVIKIAELEEEIKRDILNCGNIQRMIARELEQMQNETNKELLFMRYVEGYKLEEIAIKMNYSYIHIRHRHGTALEEFRQVWEREAENV